MIGKIRISAAIFFIMLSVGAGAANIQEVRLEVLQFLSQANNHLHGVQNNQMHAYACIRGAPYLAPKCDAENPTEWQGRTIFNSHEHSRLAAKKLYEGRDMVEKVVFTEQPELDPFGHWIDTQIDPFECPAGQCDLPRHLYNASYYALKPLRADNVIGHDAAAVYLGDALASLGRAWAAVDHAFYKQTWVLAIAHVKPWWWGGDIVQGTESERLVDARAAYDDDLIEWAHNNAIWSMDSVIQNWPDSQGLDDLVAARDAMGNARRTMLEIRNILHGGPCGEPDYHPCVIGDVDAQEFPGHAAGFWAFAPERGDLSVSEQLSAAYVLIGGVLAENPVNATMPDIVEAVRWMARSWERHLRAQHDVAMLTAKEHERH